MLPCFPFVYKGRATWGSDGCHDANYYRNQHGAAFPSKESPLINVSGVRAMILNVFTSAHTPPLSVLSCHDRVGARVVSS